LRNRLLYFPYIRIPQTKWLTQTLLYWDQVSSIVPIEFIENPESLGPYMQKLVQEELVRQVIPGQYIHEIPNFEAAFFRYIAGLGPTLDARRTLFLREAGFNIQIHIEKMGAIGDMLVDQGLARSRNYPWYEVEPNSANDFMSYLAAVLGQLPSVDSVPITDERMNLRNFSFAGPFSYARPFSRAGLARDRVVQRHQPLRISILDKILPIPNHPIEPAVIRAFKEKHHEMLISFRRRVERELIMAASISDRDLCQRHLDIFAEEAAESIQEIQASMRDARWETVRGMVSVVAAIPGVSQLFGLAGAIWDAFSGRTTHLTPSQDFAYAAFATAKWPRDYGLAFRRRKPQQSV
jgi:hypothetical protein